VRQDRNAKVDQETDANPGPSQIGQQLRGVDVVDGDGALCFEFQPPAFRSIAIAFL
jgi:hypothetical protein